LKTSTNFVSEPLKNEIKGCLLLSFVELKEVVDLKNIEVVQKFQEVFPNDI